jgi:nucleoside 2-deoxyribosyltransferase
MKIYLAGPEVFLRDAKRAGAAKIAICARYGLEGVYPLDADLDFSGLPIAEIGYAIFRANETLLDGCDALIANLTPFRGPGMDPGTAYEIGYMRGKGRPIFGYTNAELPYFERVRKWSRDRLTRSASADPFMAYEDSEGLAVEQFGFTDNLMIDSAIYESGGIIRTGKTKRAVRFTDLAAFEDCVEHAAATLLRG